MKKRTKTNENINKHPTNSQVQRIEKDIRALRDNYKTDSEIRETLGLEIRTFQKYMKRIHDADREIWLFISRNELATELLNLRQSLTNTYRFCVEKLGDNSLESSELLGQR